MNEFFRVQAASSAEVTTGSNPVADAAMERYAAGDDTAFALLYDALAPRLFRFVLAKVQVTARAEDLVQQAMLQIHRARGRFVSGSLVTPWAFSIILRLFLDQAKRRRIELLTATGYPDAEHPSAHPDPEESALANQQTGLIRQQLAQLSVLQREAFELVFFGQMSHAEAAELLGVTTASIKLRMQRCTKAIRTAVHPEAEPTDAPDEVGIL